jgi:hypothetical protein
MKKQKQEILYWLPRVLAVFFILFLVILAVKDFAAKYSFPADIIAFLLYLIPAVIFAGAAVIAWKWEDKGGMVFVFLGLLYILLAWDIKPLISYFSISGPSFLMGVLFLSGGGRTAPKKRGKR